MGQGLGSGAVAVLISQGCPHPFLHFSSLDPRSGVEVLCVSPKQPSCEWLFSATMSPFLSGATQERCMFRFHIHVLPVPKE